MLQVIDSGPNSFEDGVFPCEWRRECKVSETATQRVRGIKMRDGNSFRLLLSIAMLRPRISATLPASEVWGGLSLFRRSEGSFRIPRVLDFLTPREATSLEETHKGPSIRSSMLWVQRRNGKAASAVEALSSHWPQELISDLPWAP
jgi:hypothetical protein